MNIIKHYLLKNSFLRGVLCLLLCIVGIGNAWGEEVTVTFDASKQGYTNAQTITDVTITDGINVAFDKGTNSNTCKYYTTGTAIRVYGGGYFTIASTIGKIIKIQLTFGSGDGSNAISKDSGTYYSSTGTWEGSSERITFTIGGTSGHRRIKTIAVTYEKDANAPTAESLTISGTASNTTYYVGDTPSAEGLGVIATYNDESTKDVTSSVSWSFEPATIQSNTNSVTATASYEGITASTTYNITVNSIANTEESAYTVAQAYELIDNNRGLTEEVYVKGIISQIDSYNSTHGSITYWISDDGTTTSQQFQCYGGLDIDGTQFTSIEDLKLGSVVVVKGLLKKYNTTYELDKNNVIISNDETNARTLSSIEISGTPTKTSYYVGDTPSADGLKVNAVYSDESTINVTDDTEWTFKPEHIEEGTTQLTVTATYRSLTTSYTYDIATTTAPIAYTHTLDLSTKTYYSATTSTVEWNANVAKITLRKAESSTNANNYLGGGENAHTRVYKGQTIIITPYTSCTKMIFTSTSADYAAKSLSYENATAEVSGTEIIVTPIVNDKDITITVGVATRFVKMDIYYTPIESTVSSAGYATFCLPYDATIPEGLTAYTANDNGESVKLTAIKSGKIAANEGVVLKGDEGTYTFVAAEGNVSATAGNQMVGVTEDTPLTSADNAYMLTRKKDDGSIAFRLLATDYTLGANKAYLKLENNARNLISVVWDDNATGIYDLSEKEEVENGAIYNLAGQKLTRTQKGINIINGKLVIK